MELWARLTFTAERRGTVANTSDYKATFEIVDSDNDGRISPDELKQLMHALGDEITDDTAAEVVKVMDGDGDGRINLEEFTGYMSRA